MYTFRDKPYAWTVLIVLACINVALWGIISVATGHVWVPDFLDTTLWLRVITEMVLFLGYFGAAYLAVKNFAGDGYGRFALVGAAVLGIVSLDAAAVVVDLRQEMVLENAGGVILAFVPAIWIAWKRGWRVVKPGGQEA